MGLNSTKILLFLYCCIGIFCQYALCAEKRSLQEEVERLEKKIFQIETAYKEQVKKYSTPETAVVYKMSLASGAVGIGGIYLHANDADPQTVFTTYLVAAALGLYAVVKYHQACKTPEECIAKYACECYDARHVYEKKLTQLSQKIADALLRVSTEKDLDPFDRKMLHFRLKYSANQCVDQLNLINNTKPDASAKNYVR